MFAAACACGEVGGRPSRPPLKTGEGVRLRGKLFYYLPENVSQSGNIFFVFKFASEAHSRLKDGFISDLRTLSTLRLMKPRLLELASAVFTT